MHYCQLSWCLKQSNLILESFHGAAGELCILKSIMQLTLSDGHIQHLCCSELGSTIVSKQVHSSGVFSQPREHKPESVYVVDSLDAVYVYIMSIKR